MQPKFVYPSWYHAIRGFLIGFTLGCAAVCLAYESRLVSVDTVHMQQVYVAMIVFTAPWLVIAICEISFGIQRYHLLKKQMSDRAMPKSSD